MPTCISSHSLLILPAHAAKGPDRSVLASAPLAVGFGLISLVTVAAPMRAEQIADPNSVELDRRYLDRPVRAALFWVDGFPTVDAH